MKEIISKELLGEVLELKAIKIGRVLTSGQFSYGNRQEFYYDDGCDTIHEIINIHELAHKCKEWAWKEGFIMATYKSQSSGWLTDLFYMDKEGISDHEYGDDGFIQTFNQWVKNENSDIKACQWILENKEK